MLQDLLGSKSAAQVLLFLFVNEQCYGTQIQTLLDISLTPIQKTLQRLEEAGIVSSHYEGKLRIYRLSPTYPLRLELEALLRKAYTHLSSQEKKQYCFVHKPRLAFREEASRDRDRKAELLSFWALLGNIKKLSFSVKSKKEEEQSTKVGTADVLVSTPNQSTLVFQEKGYWMQGGVPETAFNGSFQWTLDLSSHLISLEHLRYGPNKPVFLLHLTPTKPHTLETVDAHLCSADTYLGTLFWAQEQIDFHWRIIGPSKNDQLLYHYTT